MWCNDSGSDGISNSIIGDSVKNAKNKYKYRRLLESNSNSNTNEHQHGCLRHTNMNYTSITTSNIPKTIINDTDINGGNSMTKDKDHWTTETIIHTNDYPPCLLMESISSSTAIITPHGFQSTLLLFQPINSIFIEIFPKWFYKPFVYGSIQAGYRHLNISRSYLCEQSKSYSYIISTLAYIFGDNNNHKCGGWMLCRYIAKGQDVEITTEFTHRIADYLKNHFK